MNLRRRVARLLMLLTVVAAVALPVLPARAAAPTSPLDSWNTKTIPIPAKSVIYDMTRDVLLVTIASTHPSLGNELVEVDPETGAIGRHVFVGSEPKRIAITDDGAFAYVGLDGASWVVKVDLATFAVVQRIELGREAWYGALYADQLLTVPGHNDMVIVALTDETPQYGFWMWVYKNGVRLPGYGPSFASIAYVDDTNLVGLATSQSYGSDASFYKLRLGGDALGFQPYEDDQTRLGDAGEIERAGSMVVSSRGQLIDPSGPSIVRSFGTTGRVEPTPQDDRVTFVDYDPHYLYYSNGQVSQYKLSTGELIGSRTFPEITQARELESSATGFAVPTGGSLVLLGPDVTAGDVGLPAPPPTVVQKLQPKVLPIRNNGLIYDRSRELLYASVKQKEYGGGPEHERELIAIDPATGNVVKSLPLRDEPGALALTGDASSLYVGLKGADCEPLDYTLHDTGCIVRVDLATFRIVQTFTLGLLENGAVEVGDLEVRPGTNDTLAVGLVDGYHREVVALFRNGVRLPDLVRWNWVGSIEFTDADTLYGLDNWTSGRNYYELAVTETGVKFVKDFGYATIGGNFEISNGVLFGTFGSVMDPVSVAARGRLARDYALVEPVWGMDRVFTFNGTSLTEYQLSTLRPLAQQRIAYEPTCCWSSALGDLVRTHDGFAAPGPNGIVLWNPAVCNGLEVTLAATVGETHGTPGDDVIIGTDGDDVIDGGSGNDTICGGAGNDRINGGDGNDTLIGDTGDDWLYGDAGNDQIDGVAGNDALLGGPGDDVLRGGAGSDRLRGESGADDLDGGPQVDAVYLGSDSAGAIVDLDNQADDGVLNEHDNVRTSNEVIVGTPGPDVIVGSAEQQWLRGMAGNDKLWGLGGDDLIEAGAGDDYLNGGIGNDYLSGEDGKDQCVVRPGADRTKSCETVAY